ncbi:MAG: hypothetical protein HQL66_12060, partial [Magnetococcales bacterium]|nr:hypothetical protein [Magnetococcales bacterium]
MRHENAQWLEEHGRSMREMLQEVAGQLRDMQIGPDYLLDPVVSVIQREGQQLLAQQDGVLRERLDTLMSTLRGMLAVETVQEAVRRELAGFGQTMTWQQPVPGQNPEVLVTLFRDQMAELVTGQTQSMLQWMSGMQDERMRDTLTEVLQDSGGVLSLQPLFDAVSTLSSTLTHRLDHAMAGVMARIGEGGDGVGRNWDLAADVVGQVVRRELSQFSQSLLVEGPVVAQHPELLVTAFRDQVTGLLEGQTKKIVAMLQEMEPAGRPGDWPLDAVVTVLRGEMERFIAGQEQAWRLELGALQNTLAREREATAVRVVPQAETSITLGEAEERLVGSLLEPILRTIRKEADGWSQSHGEVLRDILADLQDRILRPHVPLEPILEAIQSGKEAILARLSQPQGLDELLGAIKTENQRLLERLEQQTPMVQVIAAVQSQTDHIIAKQKEILHEGMASLLVGDGQGFPADKIMKMLRDQSDRLVEQLTNGLALQPVLQVLESHLRELGDNQFHTMHQAFVEMSAGLTTRREELEPVLRVVREEGERLVAQLAERLDMTPVLEAIVAQGHKVVAAQTEVVEGALRRHFAASGLDAGQLLASLDAHWDDLSKQIATQLNFEPLIRLVQEESRNVLAAMPEGGLREALLAGMERGEERLVNRLTPLLDVGQWTETLTGVLQRVVAEGGGRLEAALGQMVRQQSDNGQQVQAALESVVTRVEDAKGDLLVKTRSVVREELHDLATRMEASLSVAEGIRNLEGVVAEGVRGVEAAVAGVSTLVVEKTASVAEGVRGVEAAVAGVSTLVAEKTASVAEGVQGFETLLAGVTEAVRQQGEDFRQKVAEIGRQVQNTTTTEDVTEVVRHELHAFGEVLRPRWEALAQGSEAGVGVILEALAREIRTSHAGVESVLRRLLDAQGEMPSRAEWQASLMEARGEVRHLLEGMSGHWATLLTTEMGQVAKADGLVALVRAEGAEWLAAQGRALAAGFATVLDRLPAMSGIEEAMAGVESLRRELSDLMTLETQRLEELAGRAAHSLETVIASAQEQKTGIAALGGDIRDLLERQGAWFKETIAAKLESSGMAARLVTAFREEGDRLLSAQEARVAARLDGLLTELLTTMSPEMAVQRVREDVGRLAEEFRGGLSRVAEVIGQQEKVVDVTPVRGMVVEEMRELLRRQAEEMTAVAERLQDATLQATTVALIKSVRDQGEWLMDQHKQLLDPVLQAVTRNAADAVSVTALQGVVGHEVDRLVVLQEQSLTQVVDRIDALQDRKENIKAIVDAIRGENRQLQEVLHQGMPGKPLVAMMEETQRLLVGQGEEIAQRLEEIKEGQTLAPVLEGIVHKLDEIKEEQTHSLVLEGIVHKLDEIKEGQTHSPVLEGIVHKLDEIKEGQTQSPVLEGIVHKLDEIKEDLTHSPVLEGIVHKLEAIQEDLIQSPVLEGIVHKLEAIQEEQTHSPVLEGIVHKLEAIQEDLIQSPVLEGIVHKLEAIQEEQTHSPVLEGIVHKLESIQEDLTQSPVLEGIVHKLEAIQEDLTQSPVLEGIVHKLETIQEEQTHSPVLEGIVHKLEAIQEEQTHSPVLERIVHKLEAIQEEQAHSPVLEGIVHKLDEIKEEQTQSPVLEGIVHKLEAIQEDLIQSPVLEGIVHKLEAIQEEQARSPELEARAIQSQEVLVESIRESDTLPWTASEMTPADEVVSPEMPSPYAAAFVAPDAEREGATPEMTPADEVVSPEMPSPYAAAFVAPDAEREGDAMGVKVTIQPRSLSKPKLVGSPWSGVLRLPGRLPVPSLKEADVPVEMGDQARAGSQSDNRIQVVYPTAFASDPSSPKTGVVGGAPAREWMRLIRAMEEGSRQSEIDGHSLAELLESMGRFLRNHYGQEAAFLVTMADDLARRLRWGGGMVQDPALARLLDQFGDRSDAFMRTQGLDREDVQELDHGFQKAAGTLRGQISAMTSRSVRRRAVKMSRGVDAGLVAVKSDREEGTRVDEPGVEQDQGAAASHSPLSLAVIPTRKGDSVAGSSPFRTAMVAIGESAEVVEPVSPAKAMSPVTSTPVASAMAAKATSPVTSTPVASASAAKASPSVTSTPVASAMAAKASPPVTSTPVASATAKASPPVTSTPVASAMAAKASPSVTSTPVASAMAAKASPSVAST